MRSQRIVEDSNISTRSGGGVGHLDEEALEARDDAERRKKGEMSWG